MFYVSVHFGVTPFKYLKFSKYAESEIHWKTVIFILIFLESSWEVIFFIGHFAVPETRLGHLRESRLTNHWLIIPDSRISSEFSSGNHPILEISPKFNDPCTLSSSTLFWQIIKNIFKHWLLWTFLLTIGKDL